MSGDPTEVERRDDLRHRIILLQLSMDESEEARATLATLENVTSREALELAATVAIAMGDWDDASKFADRLRSTGEEGAGMLLEAEVRAMAGEINRARKLFTESERHIGNGARYRAVEVFYRSGNPELGLSIIESWADEEPENSLVQYYLGQYLDRLGRHKKGDRALREAIRLEPSNSDALNHLGYSFAERGVHLDEALELIQKALAKHPWNAAYLDSLGWVYYQMGRYEEAIEPLEQAARERPSDPTVLDHLGDLYHKIGRNDSALESWRTALKSGQGDQSETIEEKIAMLLREGR
jgi:tetratricopeptide (TPR) repeat protein